MMLGCSSGILTTLSIYFIFSIYTIFSIILSTVIILGTSTSFYTTFSTIFSTSTILGTTLNTFKISSTSTTPIIYCFIIAITPSSIYKTSPCFLFNLSSCSSSAFIKTLKWNSTFLDFSLE